jgi:hypothetical protein
MYAQHATASQNRIRLESKRAGADDLVASDRHHPAAEAVERSSGLRSSQTRRATSNLV